MVKIVIVKVIIFPGLELEMPSVRVQNSKSVIKPVLSSINLTKTNPATDCCNCPDSVIFCCQSLSGQSLETSPSQTALLEGVRCSAGTEEWYG